MIGIVMQKMATDTPRHGDPDYTNPWLGGETHHRDFELFYNAEHNTYYPFIHAHGKSEGGGGYFPYTDYSICDIENKAVYRCATNKNAFQGPIEESYEHPVPADARRK